MQLERKGPCSCTDPVSKPLSSTLPMKEPAPHAHVCCSHTHWEEIEKDEQKGTIGFNE